MSTQTLTPSPQGNVKTEMRQVRIELLSVLANPRRRANAQKMRELEASIKQKGILEPLLVRPTWTDADPNTYEVVAGQRRYQAAKKLGLKEVPCTVRAISDSEVLELQLIENIQRENMHPMEEAAACRELMELHGGNAHTVAAILGLPVRAIQHRMQLNALDDQLKKVFLDGRIAEADALDIAVMQPKDQKEVLDYIERQEYRVRPKEVRSHIRGMLRLLTQPPFDMLSATLYPKAGACTACLKRTDARDNFVGNLFEEQQALCLDGACYQEKTRLTLEHKLKMSPELVKITREYYPANGDKAVLSSRKYEDVSATPAKQRCPSAERALVVAGYRDIGRETVICRDPKCPVHGRKTSVQTAERKKARQAKQDDEILIEACLKQQPLLTLKMIAFLAEIFYIELPGDQRKAFDKGLKESGDAGGDPRKFLKNKNRKALHRYLMRAALVSCLPHRLKIAAKKEYGLDVATVLKAAHAEAQASLPITAKK
jgi:ParB family chromosome partitioning protein